MNKRVLPSWRATGLALAVIGLCAAAGLAFGQGFQRETLRVGVANIPPTMDPHASISLTASRVQYNVFETLIRMDPEDNALLTPGLAESWERVSDLELILHLRPGVLFHNGDAFTSADVVYSIERAISPESTFLLARGLLETIAEVQAVDDLTVRIVTLRPDPALEQRLASLWGSWMVPARFIEEIGLEEYGRVAVGTGPFRLVSFEPDRIVLEAFADYWGEQPNVREVVYSVIPEASSRMTALVNNEQDIINPVLPDQINLVRSFDGVDVVCEQHQLVHLLVYNTRGNPLMQDVDLRRAINLAIDRNLIVEALWDEGAVETPGHQLPEYGDMYLGDRPLTPYDPEAARALVQSSSYAGETLYYDLIPGYYDNDLEAAEIIVEMLREIGLNVQIRMTTAFWVNPDFAIHPWSYAMRFTDPLGGLWLLWGGNDEAQRQPRWVNPDPDFNQIGEQLASTFDVSARQELFGQLLDSWERQAPGTTLYRPAICWGVRDGIEWRTQPSHTMDFSADGLRFRD